MVPNRVLLIQLRRVGDVLMTTPAVRALREAWPQAHLTYMTEAPSDQLLRNNPRINEVLPFPRNASPWAHLRMLASLRRRRFDLVVDFFSNPRTAQFAWATRAPRRIGLNLRGRAWAYTDPVDLPHGLRYAAADKALLLGPLGVRAGSLLPEVFVGADHKAWVDRQMEVLGVAPDDLLVALSPVSRRAFRRWPHERFARIADILIERYAAKVLLVWGPGEEADADAVRAEMRHAALPDYPLPDLPQLAALLARATLYLGNDNGPRHLAVAVGTPTVTPFGKSFPENWTPPGQPQHRAVAHDPGCKSNCIFPRCDLDCIRGVSWESVEREVEGLLQELLKHGHPARR
jgi:ADP-heptose:LPS heptosyltransferase